MGLFKCLVSDVTTNYISGVDLGESTIVTLTLINTPIVSGTLSFQVVVEGTVVQTAVVDVNGVFTFSTIGSPSAHATAGVLNLGLGTVKLTFNTAPGSTYIIASYTGLPVYKYVSMIDVFVNCSANGGGYNSLCNTQSNGYVAAVTVCAGSLFS